jgi:large subunit ribosomal protein L21
MYAIVKTGGKQYRVERGQRLVVERLPAAEGDTVALEPILYRSEDAIFDAAALKDVQVTAKVIAHERGDKLRVFKFKPKRGYKRRTGHRQELTRIEIADLGPGKAATTKAKPATEKTAAKAAPELDTPPEQVKAPAKAKTAEKATAPERPKTEAKPKAPAKPKAAAKPKPAAKPKAPAKPKAAAKPKPAAKAKAPKEDTDGA